MEKIEILNNIKTDCSGCGVCEYICPVNAIKMKKNDEGFLYPNINYDLCLKCNKCKNACPRFSLINEEEKKFKAEIYGVKHKNQNIRLKSRSGGFFVALSDFILNKEGAVYGAIFINPKSVEHIRATNKEERDKMCGSKYVQSNIQKILPLIEEDLKNNKLVLFTGTPCQCASVHRLFNRYKTLILCDFICHGVPSPMVWEDYLNWNEKKYRDEVIEAVFRDKEKFKWSSHVEKIVFKNKTIFSKRYANLFCSNQCLRTSCYSCKFIKDRYSDITIGDYWGINEVNPKFNDEKGVSIVILRNEKAKNIYKEINDKLVMFNSSQKQPTHYNLKRPTACPKDRENFWRDYIKHGFTYVSKKYGSYDLLHRIKYKIIEKIN